MFCTQCGTPLDEVIKENPNNLAINLDQVRQVKVKHGRLKGMVRSSGFSSGGSVYSDGKMEVYCAGGKYKFGVVASYHSKTIEALKSAGIHVES